MSVFDFNPYTAIYTHLADLLFADLVTDREIIKPGNFTRTDEKPVAFKDLFAAADFPDVVFMQDGFGGSPFGPGSSNSDAVLTQSYILRMSERSVYVDRVNDIKLSTLAALTKAGPTLGYSTPQHGHPVEFWRITQGGEPRIHPNGHAVLGVMQIQVQMRLALGWLQQL